MIVPANHQPLEGAHKIDRFRFDATSTGRFVDDQHNRTSAGCSLSGSGSCHDNQNFRASQGNLQHLPHTSCTSIAQNLSTNDQQPLIVESQYDRCQHHSQQPHNALGGRCCLETTSFMATNNPLKCVCCDQKTKGAERHIACSNACTDARSHEDLGISYDDQMRSRTLTRVYKPLNDVHFPNTSTSNLADTFCVPLASPTKGLLKRD